MINWLIFCSFIFSMAMTLLGLLVDLSYQFTYQPKVSQWQQEQTQRLSNYLSQDEKWRQHAIFRPMHSKDSDLGHLLAEVQQGDLQKPLISAELKKEFLSLGDHWMQQKHKVENVDTVLMFFNSMENYDHFKLLTPLKHGQASDFVVAGQLYLAFHFHFKPEDVRSALTKTRHLSKILLNTHSLKLRRAGLALLEKERQLIDELKARFLKSRLLWTPVSDSELASYRKHLVQTASYFSPLTPSEILNQVFLGEKLPVGFCSVYEKKLPLIYWGKPYLNPTFIFEPKFNAVIQSLDAVILRAQRECPELIEPPVPPEISWTAHIPYYRRLFAIKFILKAETSRRVL